MTGGTEGPICDSSSCLHPTTVSSSLLIYPAVEALGSWSESTSTEGAKW